MLKRRRPGRKLCLRRDHILRWPEHHTGAGKRTPCGGRNRDSGRLQTSSIENIGACCSPTKLKRESVIFGEGQVRPPMPSQPTVHLHAEAAPLSVDHLLEMCRIAFALHRNLGHGGVDVTQIVGGHLDPRRVKVLLKPMQFRSSGNRNNPRFLRE